MINYNYIIECNKYNVIRSNKMSNKVIKLYNKITQRDKINQMIQLEICMTK